MKQEDIKKSLDQIELDDKVRQKMIDNILKYKIQKSEIKYVKKRNFRFALSVFAFVLVVVGSVAGYNLLNNGRLEDNWALSIGGGIATENNTNSIQENMMAVVNNQFMMEDMYYTLLPDALKADFVFPESISEKDVGKKITTISTTVDPNLMGCEVYEYLPAGSLAVVAVKINNVYKLFNFFNYESYINNKDEDTTMYLNLYGIHSAEDIAKIQFIGHSEESKIAGRAELISEPNDYEKIAEFYDYYSVMKDSSIKYFDKLMKYKALNINNSVPVNASDIFYDTGNFVVDSETTSDGTSTSGSTNTSPIGITSISSSGSISPSGSISTSPSGSTSTTTSGSTSSSGSTSTSGSIGSVDDALSDSVTIRIYNQYGVFYETEYYPKIGFISRHEVSDEFANYLKDYIG